MGDPAPVIERAYEVFIEAPGERTSYRIAPSTPGPILIGHSVVCPIRLSDRNVSRRHAALELVEQGLQFTDLGSTNGSFLGTTRIRDVVLQGGEHVRLGSATMRVQLVPSAATESASARGSFGRVLGESPSIRRLFPLFDRLAATRVPVVIEGETGTGKEVLAESIHLAGSAPDAPYVVFDCTTVHSSLLESELFGHERGAFTGAVATRKGVFELAHGGTLLIDEIGDLDLTLQPKLLRVLERGEIRRVGGNESIAVSVRVLAATRRNLDLEVAAGRFRDDLFHRLAVARVELPPLRKRREDIPMLARIFWEQAGGAQADFPVSELGAWIERDWPGNIRELRNAVARRFAMGMLPPATVTNDDDDSLDAAASMDLPLPEIRRIVGERLERRYIRRMLDRHGGNATRAAEASGIALRHFHRLKARAQ